MDEVGRGTTPVDGLAIAYACLHHLYTINRSRALFATHFHQLGDMVAGFDNVGCYCTDLDEAPDGSFTYVHKLRKGVNTRSHALKVARLAGMCESQSSLMFGCFVVPFVHSTPKRLSITNSFRNSGKHYSGRGGNFIETSCSR